MFSVPNSPIPFYVLINQIVIPKKTQDVVPMSLKYLHDVGDVLYMSYRCLVSIGSLSNEVVVLLELYYAITGTHCLPLICIG